MSSMLPLTFETRWDDERRHLEEDRKRLEEQMATQKREAEKLVEEQKLALKKAEEEITQRAAAVDTKPGDDVKQGFSAAGDDVKQGFLHSLGSAASKRAVVGLSAAGGVALLKKNFINKFLMPKSEYFSLRFQFIFGARNFKTLKFRFRLHPAVAASVAGGAGVFGGAYAGVTQMSKAYQKNKLFHDPLLKPYYSILYGEKFPVMADSVTSLETEKEQKEGKDVNKDAFTAGDIVKLNDNSHGMVLAKKSGRASGIYEQYALLGVKCNEEAGILMCERIKGWVTDVLYKRPSNMNKVGNVRYLSGTVDAVERKELIDRKIEEIKTANAAQ